MSVVRKFANAPLIFICGAVLLIFESMIGIFSYEKKRLCLFVSLGFIFFTAAGAVFVMYYFYGYWKDYGSQHLSADVNYTRLLRDIIANAKLFGDSGIDMKNTYGITAWNMALRNTNSYLILARYGWAAFIATKLPMTAFSVYSFYRCLCQTSMLGKLISSSAALCLTALSVVLLFSPLFGSMTGYGEAFSSYASLLFNLPLAALMLSVLRSDSIVRDNMISETAGNYIME